MLHAVIHSTSSFPLVVLDSESHIYTVFKCRLHTHPHIASSPIILIYPTVHIRSSHSHSQTELTSEVNPTKTHLANMGRMIEDMEYDIRSNMNELYIMKTKEVVNSIHRYGDGPIQKSAFVASLNAAVIGHGAKKEKGVPSILH
jgi:F-actin capping protein, beta subunit